MRARLAVRDAAGQRRAQIGRRQRHAGHRFEHVAGRPCSSTRSSRGSSSVASSFGGSEDEDRRAERRQRFEPRRGRRGEPDRQARPKALAADLAARRRPPPSACECRGTRRVACGERVSRRHWQPAPGADGSFSSGRRTGGRRDRRGERHRRPPSHHFVQLLPRGLRIFLSMSPCRSSRRRRRARASTRRSPRRSAPA